MKSALATLVISAALFTAACGDDADHSGPTGDVRIVSGQQAQNGAVLQSIFDRYNTTATDGKVTLEINNQTDTEIGQKVLADARAGTLPDALRVTNATVRIFVDSGLAQPLDSCLDSDTALKQQLDPALYTAGSSNGHLFMMPWYTTAPALFYNASAFTEAGLDPNTPPQTFSQIRTAAAALTDPGKHRYGVSLQFGNSYNFEGALRSGGGQMMTDDGRPAFNSPAGIAVFDFWRQLVEQGVMTDYPNFFTDVADAFTNGQLAMYLGSASSFGGLSKKAGFPVRMAPMPIPDGGTRSAPLSTNGFVMLTKDPQRQQATCAALKQLVTPETVTETVKATATVPLNQAAAQSEDYLAGFLRENIDLQKVNSQPSFSWYALPGKGNSEFQADYLDAQTLALSGRRSPQEALDDLAAQTQALLEQR
jgi:multiple sugar transport system substrate-binding protein